MALREAALNHQALLVQKQAGTVMSKWLNDRGITSPMLTELGRNARDSGWHRPLVGFPWLSFHWLQT